MAIGSSPLSFAALLYRPIFDRLAVAAKLTLETGEVFDTMPDGSPLAALDKTVGVSLQQGGGIVVETVTPVAELMMADLTALGVSKNQVDGSTISLNGRTWAVISHKMNPSSSGELDGTIYLQLEGDPVDE